ncbi:MAG: Maf family protein, partial [Betaproteobacteria bacterium]|nr:Maf family protein [Betaproteobacteria bacterium]
MIAAPNILYLASKSPRRRELLRQIGVHFELLLLREKHERLDVDESPLPNELPRDYVMRVVRLKAAAARRAQRDRKLPERLILTADTTVTLDAAILGKPADRVDAARMLEKLS